MVAGQLRPLVDDYVIIHEQSTERQVGEVYQEHKESPQHLEGLGAAEGLQCQVLQPKEEATRRDVSTVQQSSSENQVPKERHIRMLQELIDMLEGKDTSEREVKLPTSKDDGVNIQASSSKELQALRERRSKSRRGLKNKPQTQKKESAMHCGQSKGPSAWKAIKFKEINFEKDSADFWVKELFDACQLLKSLCDSFVSAEPSISGTFLSLATISPALDRFYICLSEVSFVLSAFSALLVSVATNIMSGFSLSYLIKAEPQHLVTALRKVTYVYMELGYEFQNLYAKCVLRASSVQKCQNANQTERQKQTGKFWLINTIHEQLNVASENLKAAYQRMDKICDLHANLWTESSSELPDFETETQQRSMKETFLIAGEKFRLIEEQMSSLLPVLRMTENMV